MQLTSSLIIAALSLTAAVEATPLIFGNGGSSSTALSYSKYKTACYNDASFLLSTSYVSLLMTNEACGAYCYNQGYQYSGTSGNTCSCTATAPTSVSALCPLVCSGDLSQRCGSAASWTVYTANKAPVVQPPSPATTTTTTTSTSTTSTSTSTSTSTTSTSTSTSTTSTSTSTTSTSTSTSTTASSTPSNVPFKYSGNSLGCYYDEAGSGSSRTFAGPSTSSSSMTNEVCANFCGDAGYKFSGVEYSSECFCSNIAPTKKTGATCNMPCSGNANETCGGSWSMSVFDNTAIAATTSSTPGANYASLGCFADSTGNRTFTAYSYANSTMTPQSCAATCSSKGHAYSGTEYGSECYCGDYLPLATSNACNMACSGNSATICGGSNALTVYKDSTIASDAKPTCPNLPQGYAICKYVNGACVVQ
ncbi:unnamed protein product [Parajaminaea phylloscopi]